MTEDGPSLGPEPVFTVNGSGDFVGALGEGDRDPEPCTCAKCSGGDDPDPEPDPGSAPPKPGDISAPAGTSANDDGDGTGGSSSRDALHEQYRELEDEVFDDPRSVLSDEGTR